MSIVTRTGDQGLTNLMYQRRVSKCNARVEACGTIDELSAAIGLARAAAPDEAVAGRLALIQKDLIILMGELATSLEDLPRYLNDGYSLTEPAMTGRLDGWVQELEAASQAAAGWALPGASLPAAALDVARTVCRRAERRVCALHESGELQNPELQVFLNRLSDLLWLMARQAEQARS